MLIQESLTAQQESIIFNHMVERDAYLDNLFGSLADPVRRDILQRLIDAQYTVSQLAQNYEISFAAVAKHLNVLEKARLVIKQRRGKEQVVSISPDALRDARQYLDRYEAVLNRRYDALDKILKEDKI